MRRIKGKELAFTLFPFMDVLTGVIGVLILIICTLALLGVNQSTIVFDAIVGAKDGNPVFLECLDDRIVIHGESTEDVPLGDAPFDVLESLVSRLSAQNYRKNRFVLAVRPSGVQTFDTIRELMSKADLRYGFEPTPANQKIKIRTKGQAQCVEPH